MDANEKPAPQPLPYKLRALIVDDESHVRIVLREILGNLNCEVVGEARTGMEAVDLYRAVHPDFVILDLNMPVLSGEEFLMLILPEDPDAVVIMLTSMTDTASVDTCLELGAVNYIRKDTPLAEIRAIIAETLNDCFGPGGEP